MPRSPASSEEEEGGRGSEYPEPDSDSGSSREGPPGPGRAPRPPPEEAQFSMMVFRIGIPDLHQTFLDEERPLRDYPQSFDQGVPYLEVGGYTVGVVTVGVFTVVGGVTFRYKTRVYKQTNLDEKQLAKLHTKTGLRKFLDYVQHGSAEKVARLLERGLDPNYHDSDSGGCHQGVPRVSRCHPQALLDLGGSPNYKDRRGLTPLYHTAMVGGDPRCCELLLYNRAHIGTADENGWQEIHQ
ncbi:SH3 and multiple ankyrin repeat domains protein 1, partial [Lonchura striata]